MNLTTAFIKGAQFAIGANQLAQDAKAKKDDEIHWRTIGEGEEAHAVPIAGPEPNTKKAEPKAKKAEPKAKKAESKAKKVSDGKIKYNINDTRKALRDGVNASHISRADEIKWNDARRQMGEAIKATKIQEKAMIQLIDGALEREELTTAQAKQLKDKLKDVQKDMPELIKQAENAIEAVKNNLMNDRDLEGKIESLDNAARRALKINSAVVHVGSDLRQYKSETEQKRQEEIAQRMQRERDDVSPTRELLGRSLADDPLLLAREGGAAALASSPTAMLDELRASVQAQMDRLDDQTRNIDNAKAQKDLSESLNSLSRATDRQVFKTRQITKESQASGVASSMYDMLDEARDKAQEQGDSRKLAKLALLANMYTSAAKIGLNNIETYAKIRQKAEQRPRDETDKYAKQHNEAIANAKRVIEEQWNSLKSAKKELKNALKSIGIN